jgi:hypothetical protein
MAYDFKKHLAVAKHPAAAAYPKEQPLFLASLWFATAAEDRASGGRT